MEKISVVIPAHNEEKYIENCLASIRTAAEQIDIPVAMIVSLNRCSDKTADIAKSHGATTVEENEKNIAKIRNAGAQAATGDVIITIDADSWMSPNMLHEVVKHLKTGNYIGGGVRIKPERLSIGIIFSLMMVIPYLIKSRISAGMFWMFKEDFTAIGGFDENRFSAEDVDFARRLKSYGASKNLKYGTIKNAYITTSCRKFDQFGDWYLFKHPGLVRAVFKGDNQTAADGFYYDADR
jgi:hypothetical protein